MALFFPLSCQILHFFFFAFFFFFLFLLTSIIFFLFFVAGMIYSYGIGKGDEGDDDKVGSLPPETPPESSSSSSSLSPSPNPPPSSSNNDSEVLEDEWYNSDEEEEKRDIQRLMNSYMKAAKKFVSIFPHLASFKKMAESQPSMEGKEGIFAPWDSIVWDLCDRPPMPFREVPRWCTNEKDIFQNAIIACWSLYPRNSMGLQRVIDYLAEKTITTDLQNLSPELIETLKAIAAQNVLCRSDLGLIYLKQNASAILFRSAEQVSFGVASGNQIVIMNERCDSLPAVWDLVEQHPGLPMDEIERMHKKMVANLYQGFSLPRVCPKGPQNRRSCENVGCPKTEPVEIGGAIAAEHRFKTCARCKKAFYCSRECQANHWKLMHKRMCKAS